MMAIETISRLLMLLQAFFAELTWSQPWFTLAFVIGILHIIPQAVRKYLDYRVSQMGIIGSIMRAVY
jgi:type II secretory pathway component PulF